MCVHPELTYIKIHDEEHNTNYILCDQLLGTLYKDPKKAKFKKLASYKGIEMKGWRYVPLFEYFTEQVCELPPFFVQFPTILQYEDRAFRVLVDTYVTATDGTGIVQQAPAFGEDDARVAIENGILYTGEMAPCPLDDAGKFTKPVTDFEGMYIKVCHYSLIELFSGAHRWFQGCR